MINKLLHICQAAEICQAMLIVSTPITAPRSGFSFIHSVEWNSKASAAMPKNQIADGGSEHRITLAATRMDPTVAAGEIRIGSQLQLQPHDTRARESRPRGENWGSGVEWYYEYKLWGGLGPCSLRTGDKYLAVFPDPGHGQRQRQLPDQARRQQPTSSAVKRARRG